MNLPDHAQAPKQTPRLAKPRFRDRLGDSIPGPGVILVGSPAFGALMSVMAAIDLYERNRFETQQWAAILTLFFLGGAMAFAPSLFCAQLIFNGRRGWRRFLGGALVIALVTHLCLAGLFALQYRMFYAHWHAPFPSRIWAFQFSFTSASALYQYTVLSLGLYGVPGLMIFLGFGWWFHRRSH